MIANAVYHNGRVATRYYMPIPKFVSVNGRDYVTDVQHGVSILFADEADVPALLEYLGGCCGGQKKVFSLCGREAFNVYMTGNR